MRQQARLALQNMGLVLDVVGTVADAAAFCQSGLPHAIVLDEALRGAPWDQLVASIRCEVPEFVVIELVESGQAFDISSVSSSGMARVGYQAIAQALPSALVYELTRVM